MENDEIQIVILILVSSEEVVDETLKWSHSHWFLLHLNIFFIFLIFYWFFIRGLRWRWWRRFFIAWLRWFLITRQFLFISWQWFFINLSWTDLLCFNSLQRKILSIALSITISEVSSIPGGLMTKVFQSFKIIKSIQVVVLSNSDNLGPGFGLCRSLQFSLTFGWQ